MPWFALIGRDGPDALERRRRQRPAHLDAVARLDAQGRVRYGGFLKNERGEPTGSLLVFEAENLGAAKALAAGDPYVLGGVFESYEVVETEPVFPKPRGVAA